MKSERITAVNKPGKPIFEFTLINRLSKELSTELHDNVLSKLSIIRLNLSHNPNEISEAVKLLDTVIGSVREISHGLYSPSLEHLNFIDAVRDFVSPLHKVINIEIHNIHNHSCSLDSREKLFLFRIFQEVIHNILKHSNATKISISLRSSKGFFYCLVKDDGNGFLNDLVQNQGIGLKNIKYRAYELRAKYKFKSRINKGSLFIISVPIL
jgi:two-component system NarL family sensor kinase